MIPFISAGKAPGGSESVAVELLDGIGFTDHAIERFAERAGLQTRSRPVIEPIVRELLLREGWLVAKRPAWARSRNRADIYLQLGEWMLFIGCRDRRNGRHYAIVTVENRPGTTWRKANRRRYVRAAPPARATRRKPSRLVSAGIAIRERPRLAGLHHAIKATHRARRERAAAEYEWAILEGWRRSSRSQENDARGDVRHRS